VTPFAVFASGSGTNLQAILDAVSQGHIYGNLALVVCNSPGAGAIARAEASGVPVAVIDHRVCAGRADFEARIDATLRAAGIEWIVLAGFMRILTPEFVRQWSRRILNIHPSLLPAFPGVDAMGQALAAGVKVSGCTVHFVDEGVDTGPIIAQVAVPVLETDDHDTLAARIQRVEHSVYPKVVQKALNGGLRVEGRIVHVEGGGP
jgi:phosphoribosylglycinamide formyltransferase-1